MTAQISPTVTKLLATVIALSALVLSPEHATACSCVGETLESAIQNTPMIFVGRVRSVRGLRGGRVQTTFQVEQPIKGIGRTQTIRVSWTPPNGYSCDTVGPRHGLWVVFAHGSLRSASFRSCDAHTSIVSPYSAPTGRERVAQIVSIFTAQSADAAVAAN